MASLCSFFQATVLQSRIDIDNIELVNSHLLLDAQLQTKINATIESFKKNASARILSFLNYIRTTIQANYVVSALNTNVLIAISEEIPYQFILSSTETSYTGNSSVLSSNTMSIGCSDENPTSTPGYLKLLNIHSYQHHRYWFKSEVQDILPIGFLTGCTPFEALLKSTLDCLYDTECLRTFTVNFPSVSHVSVFLSSSSHLFFCLATLELD